jgi:hypothetical protein
MFERSEIATTRVALNGRSASKVSWYLIADLGARRLMALDSFFNAADSARVTRTLRNLALHDISPWALTGGVAIELHILHNGGQPITRELHDLDFMTASFDTIPAALGNKLLVRHAHPHDPPGKNMLQGVDPETEVRIDVFRAYGLEMDRASVIEIAALALQMVSLQDLVARHARLNWNLMEGKPIAPKYARDFLRLIELVTIDEVECIWQEHRTYQSPESFAETVQQLRRVIGSRPDLLVPPTYSTNVYEVCQRCQGAEAFPLADPRRILSILGYC